MPLAVSLSTLVWVVRPVLLREASVRHTYEPPVHAFVTRQVMVRPPVQRIIDHPPVVALRHDRVLVRQGGYGWALEHHWIGQYRSGDFPIR